LWAYELWHFVVRNFVIFLLFFWGGIRISDICQSKFQQSGTNKPNKRQWCGKGGAAGWQTKLIRHSCPRSWWAIEKFINNQQKWQRQPQEL